MQRNLVVLAPAPELSGFADLALRQPTTPRCTILHNYEIQTCAEGIGFVPRFKCNRARPVSMPKSAQPERVDCYWLFR